MTVLKENSNCWCITHADKAAFLIDGAAYFSALADAIDQAKKTIFIAAKVKRTPELHVNILNWDFPMLYVREREWLPILKLGWKTHGRIFYHQDDQHPVGASQHQKLVVIDNQVTFWGGLDLTNSRWDTPEHRLDDPRRTTPDGEAYPPFHDIQMAVQGEAAEKAVYIETRYLTSAKIAGALENSLSQEQGPDICIVLPKESSGWLEPSTMDSIRARVLKQLSAADDHHRLQVFYPALDDEKTALYVHAKLMTVEDRLRACCRAF